MNFCKQKLLSVRKIIHLFNFLCEANNFAFTECCTRVKAQLIISPILKIALLYFFFFSYSYQFMMQEPNIF